MLFDFILFHRVSHTHTSTTLCCLKLKLNCEHFSHFHLCVSVVARFGYCFSSFHLDHKNVLFFSVIPLDKTQMRWSWSHRHIQIAYYVDVLRFFSAVVVVVVVMFRHFSFGKPDNSNLNTRLTKIDFGGIAQHKQRLHALFQFCVTCNQSSQQHRTNFAICN